MTSWIRSSLAFLRTYELGDRLLGGNGNWERGGGGCLVLGYWAYINNL